MVPSLRLWRWAKATRSGSRAMRAVVVHDLADHAGRDQPGQPRDIDRRLGMPGADQRAAVARHQREHVAGGHDVVAPAFGVDRDRDGVRAVGAEMPVVTPSRASIETVNAVWWRVPLDWLISDEAELLDALRGSSRGRSGRARGGP